MAHTSKLTVDYHPFSTVTWCLLQKGYHCVCLSVSDTGNIQIVVSIYTMVTFLQETPGDGAKRMIVNP
jgi:hypothetical protein